MSTQQFCTAFAEKRLIAAGELTEVALKAKRLIDDGMKDLVLIFDDSTAHPIEIDFRGTESEVLSKLQNSLKENSPYRTTETVSHDCDTATVRKAGRPKLGVVSREVTLLPRHWDWLNDQQGGASVVLRRLVDEARKANPDKHLVRQSQEAAYRFMSGLAGNEQGFEEATRALFANDQGNFKHHTQTWPTDVRAFAMKLATNAFTKTN